MGRTETKPKPAAPKTGEAVKERPLSEIIKEAATQPMPRGIAIALLVALAISGLSIGLANYFDLGIKMRHWIEGAGVWAPLAYIGLKALTYVIAPLSGTPVKLAGGALFGFWGGAFYVVIGDMLGASLNFWIARLFRDGAIARLIGRRAVKQVGLLTDNVGGWRALLAARLFLSSVYDFISYAAGLSKLPFRQFFWVSLLAGIPSTLFASWISNATVTSKKFLYIMFVVSAVCLLIIVFSQKKPEEPAKKD